MKWIHALTLPALLLGLLELWARTIGKSSDSLAAPSAAVIAFFRALSDGSLLASTSFTLGSAAAGLGIGCLLGVFFGTLIGLSKRVASISFLSVEVLRPIPSVALIPLAMLMFGFGFRLEISVVAFACFWPILILTQAAVQQVEPCLLEVARALQLSQGEQFLKIVLPAIVPRLFVALRLGVAIALVVAVTVEIAANPHGMGYAIIYAQQSLDPALMLAWLFWISIVGFTINFGAMKLQTFVSMRMGEMSTLEGRQ
jgi:sulfonate transport system permease protein